MRKIPHSIQRPLRYFIALASAGLFVYLVWHAGPANLWKQLLKLGWGFTLVIAVAGVSHLAKTWAWQMMLGEDRNKMSFARLFGLRLGAEAAGQLGILGQTLGDSIRVSQLSREADMATSLASVTLDRALFVVTGILVTVAGILAALPLLSLSHSAQLCAWIFVFGSLALLVLMLVAMKRRWPFLSGSVRLLGHLPWLKNWVDREFALIESMENALLDFFHHCPKKFWMSIALNLACQCMAVLEVCLILSFLGTNVSFLRALTIEGCTKILNAVGSFNPGNVGTYEGGNMLISRVLSFGTATGLALALARRLRAFFWTTVGGVCLFLLTAQRKPSKNPRTSRKNPGELAGQPQSGSGEKGATFALLLPDSCNDCDAFSAPLARVGALPIVLRTILAAQQKANASRVLVVAGSKTRKHLQRCLESTGRLPNSTQWLDAADNSFFEALRVVRGQAAHASVVLVDGTSTYHPSLIRLAGEWDCGSGALALTSMGKPVGILVLPSESLSLLSTNLATPIANFADLQTCLAATQSVVAKTVEDDLWQPVHSENDRLLAEKKLDHWLVKPTDGMYARLNRKISVPISRQLIKLPITANMVSLFTLAVGFVSAVFFALGGYWNTLLGAFLCLFASILDGCDGEVARLKLLESDFGCWLETACDYVFYFFLLAGMSIGQWRTSGSATFLAWGGLLLFGALASFLAVAWQRHRLAAGRPEQLLGIWHSHADSRPSNRLLYAARHMEFMVRRCFFPYALVVFALFGIMNIAFILSVISANLVWPIALYSSRTFARVRTSALPNATASA
jgi:phosphatidylglycerophosphate synthase